MSDPGDILDILKESSCGLRDLCGSRVDIINAPIDPFAFHKEYVAANKPCLIRGATNDWAAHSLWNNEYLKSKLADLQVPVAVTPNGQADAVTRSESGKEVFALPYDGKLPMSELLEHLTRTESNDSSPHNVIYMQQQNDCLRKEFSALLPDVTPGLKWADHVFGNPPEAVNLWLGNDKSVTSFHKDHYENLFAVVQGTKTFTVLPPNDVYRLDLQEYKVAQYERDLSQVHKSHTDVTFETCSLRLTEQSPEVKVRWCPIDPDTDERNKHPLFFCEGLPDPMVIDVHPGEVLYLPSLWHHHVKQHNVEGGICIAVNFWYDMVMGANYANFCLAEKLAAVCA